MRMQPVLTSDDVQKMMEACKAEARKNNWAVSIAIVDAAGALLQFERLDGARASTAEVAPGKAKASAMMHRPSGMLADVLKDYPSLGKLDGIWVQGAVPLMHEGFCVGAIGVSGVKAAEDEQVAKAGAAVLS